MMQFFKPGVLSQNGNVFTFTERADLSASSFALYVQSSMINEASTSETGKRYHRYLKCTVSNFQEPTSTGMAPDQ